MTETCNNERKRIPLFQTKQAAAIWVMKNVVTITRPASRGAC